MDTARVTLLELDPENAATLGKRTVEAASVQHGDTFEVAPGGVVPIDGTVVWGETTVDESGVTGEALPVRKAVGSVMYASSVNRGGTVRARAHDMAPRSSGVDRDTAQRSANACCSGFAGMFRNTSVLVCLLPCGPRDEDGRCHVYPLAACFTIMWIVGVVVVGMGLACQTGAAGDVCAPGTETTVMIAVGAVLFAPMPLLCFVGCCCSDDY